MCPPRLSDLSDQALMEAAIDELTENAKEKFRQPDGTYKDTCKWEGVTCNGRRRVTGIEWCNGDLKEMEAHPFDGYMSLNALPLLLENLYLKFDNPHRDPVISLKDTAALPRNLKFLHFEFVTIFDTLDLHRLPPAMNHVSLQSCAIEGSCFLTRLPRRLGHLSMKDNCMWGTISLDQLPPLFHTLDLSKNELEGTLNLTRFPAEMCTLVLDDNKFSGEINLNFLPDEMSMLTLSNNKLRGNLAIPNPPERLRWLDVRGNRFRGGAVIARHLVSYVAADENVMRKAVDENGFWFGR